MSPESPRFSINLIGRAARQFERLAARAEERNLRGLLAALFRQIVQTLETRPREWGDPYCNYRGLSATGYGVTLHSGRLRIAYAVHTRNR
jgi:hypothetical protein